LNESGLINTKRLQFVLDEMALWEQEVFEKEYYRDLNWYKGKRAKHVNEMEWRSWPFSSLGRPLITYHNCPNQLTIS
jgi:hypothetical protein